MKTYTIDIDWDRIHAACEAVDAARAGMENRGNSQGLWDHFGGTYCRQSYERYGLAGIVRINTVAHDLARQCWDAVHAASQRLASSVVPRESDYVTVYRSVGCSGHSDMTHRTHRGAAWRATRFGGRVQRDRVLVSSGITARRMGVLRQTQAAVTTAVAVHDLLTVLSESGVCQYEPRNHICGVVDGRINLTGLGWLTGTREYDGGYPLADVAAVLC